MIQRIQSIFLLLASLFVLSLFMPSVALATADMSKSAILPAFLQDGIFNLKDSDLLLFLVLGAGVLALISIFLFKNRKTQMKIVALMMIVSLAVAVIAFWLFYHNTENIKEGVAHLDYGMAGPFLSIIFGSLANRAIRKDEKLVKSMDRLR
ncbi:MAG TPA: DUF4293 domain-containing protein [Saprospiraceae bacterium]|nr:DUF4293 domain-containing protein [Saprospiraceae bacterium]